MKHRKLDEMTRGWFVGAFSPTAHTTDACEVAVKHYQAGDKEAAHYHKVATEITLVLSGHVRIFENEWHAGDIIILEPGEVTAFEALTDSITVVVKTPGALDDKFLVTSAVVQNNFQKLLRTPSPAGEGGQRPDGENQK